MEALKMMGKTLVYLFVIPTVIAIRTVCRFVGSLIFNIVNIFVGIKNLFVLTMQGSSWFRWPLLIVKLPVVLTIQVIKLVLTATLGTLFNFFESISMLIRFWTCEKNTEFTVKKLYELNCREYELNYQKEIQDIAKLCEVNYQGNVQKPEKKTKENMDTGLYLHFIFGQIDIENRLAEISAKIKKCQFIENIIQNVGKFCTFGNRMSACAFISYVNTFDTNIDLTPCFWGDKLGAARMYGQGDPPSYDSNPMKNADPGSYLKRYGNPIVVSSIIAPYEVL